MSFQIACGKSNIYDSPQPKPSKSPNIFSIFNTINKQTLDTYNDHLYHRAKSGRHKSISQNQSQNYFTQMSAINVQNIYTAIKKQIKTKDTDVLQQLTRSLNGTWFKNIISQTCQYSFSSLYTRLGLRRQNQQRRKKKNPLLNQQSNQKQYRQPNIFPARRGTSLNLYSNNLRQHRKLAVDYNDFRSAQVEGKGLASVQQQRMKNEGWLKGQIIKDVIKLTLDQKEQQKKKNRKPRVSKLGSSRDRYKEKHSQEFVLLSKKAKLNC